MPPYIWCPISLNALLYVWIPPILGWPPSMCGSPQYVWMPPVCLDTPICLDAPLYAWAPLFGNLPVCLNTLPMFGCPHVCLDDVLMPPVNAQHKESMLCQTKEVSICPPYIWMPLYVWTPPYVWMCLMFWCPSYDWMALIHFDTLLSQT